MQFGCRVSAGTIFEHLAFLRLLACPSLLSVASARTIPTLFLAHLVPCVDRISCCQATTTITLRSASDILSSPLDTTWHAHLIGIVGNASNKHLLVMVSTLLNTFTHMEVVQNTLSRQLLYFEWSPPWHLYHLSSCDCEEHVAMVPWSWVLWFSTLFVGLCAVLVVVWCNVSLWLCLWVCVPHRTSTRAPDGGVPCRTSNTTTRHHKHTTRNTTTNTQSQTHAQTHNHKHIQKHTTTNTSTSTQPHKSHPELAVEVQRGTLRGGGGAGGGGRGGWGRRQLT